MPGTSQTSPLWFPGLLLLLAVTFFVGLGWPALFDLDEGAFSAATFEMLVRGDYITTYLNGEPRFDKPILIYWFQALSVTVFGANEFGFRLPSAIAATLWVLVLFHFARPRIGERSAFFVALVTATALVITIIGRGATADALLNLLLTLTMLDIYRYFESEDKGRLIIYRVYFWMALGFLCKGPVAVAIPLVVTLIFAIGGRHIGHLWRALFNPVGWVIFLAVAAPWYILEYQAQGQAFIDGFFLKHNISRFSDTMEGHGGSLFYYIPVIFLVVMPYGGQLIRLLAGARKTSGDSLNLFLWIWFGFVFLLFSFSSTQLPHYALYGTPPLLMLMVKYREWLQSRLLAAILPLALSLVVFLLPEILAVAVTQEDHPYRLEVIRLAQEVLSGPWHRIWSGLLLLAAVSILIDKRLKPFQGLMAFGVIQTLFLVFYFIPAVSQVQQGPLVKIAEIANQMSPKPVVVMSGVNMPSITIQLQQIVHKRRPQGDELLFTRIDQLPKYPGYEVIYSDGGLVLAGPESR